MYGTYYILPWVTLLSSSLSFARGVGAVPLSKYTIFIRFRSDVVMSRRDRSRRSEEPGYGIRGPQIRHVPCQWYRLGLWLSSGELSLIPSSS